MQSMEMINVELGDALVKITARGKFRDQDARDFVPTEESKLLYVDTPNYDGPLDLLLHLIRKHSLDIFDIPIVLITQKYLEALEEIPDLNFDLAGEFILMAATLTEIKSKMLLPKDERVVHEDEEDEGCDPRRELVKRLLSYKSFQEASMALANRSVLGRDVFRRVIAEDDKHDEVLDLSRVKPVPIFDLLDKLALALKKAEGISVHTVTRDRISVSARMHELLDFAQVRAKFSFYDALKFFPLYDRVDVIVTFLALLELSRLKLFRLHASSIEDLLISVVKENFYQASREKIFDESEVQE